MNNDIDKKEDKKNVLTGEKTLTSKLPDDIKEKHYLTKQVDTSIAILDTPEDDIILESLLFLSKYADHCIENFNYLQQRGLLEKLLALFNRNICILRLSLRLLNVLLTNRDVLSIFDQEIYDEHIKSVTDFYITHEDVFVKEFAVSVLKKLANSCRITTLIFSVDLLNPILASIKNIKNPNLIQNTLALFDVLLTSPTVLGILPELKNFDVNVIINYLNHTDQEIVKVAFQIISKFTFFGLESYQNMFKEKKLVEKMLEVIMEVKMITNHDTAMQIVLNCMNSDVTSTYFVESLSFLKFCCWVKNCDPGYLPKCIQIFLKLSAIPSVRQLLFDLSVEESILYFLRSNDKFILNRTCEAISNMSEHRYCCEHILTGTVIKTIYDILERTDDEEDPKNDVAIKTLSNLTKRSLKTVHILHYLEAEQKFVDLVSKGLTALSPEGYLQMAEIIYHFIVHPVYHESLVTDKVFRELLKITQSDCEDVAILATEMITYCIANPDFIQLFINLEGPAIIVARLERTKNEKLLKSLMILIHSTLSNEIIMLEFLKNDLGRVLKKFSETMSDRAPIIQTISNLICNIYLPLKFFETKRLNFIDKLNNKFYLIRGYWPGPFPFLDILRYHMTAPITTIYVVDYTYQVVEPTRFSTPSLNSTEESTYSVRRSINEASEHLPVNHTIAAYQINYGDLSSDPYLPQYIYHINKSFGLNESIKDKIKMLAMYIDTVLCGPEKTLNIETYKLHLQSLKIKLGTNMIPIGYLRIGYHCERSLLFKAIADRTGIPCSLVQGEQRLYWNEVALLEQEDNIEGEAKIVFYVIDLMDKVGTLMALGTKEADQYCYNRIYKEV